MLEKRVDKNLTIPTGYVCNNRCRFCMESDREARCDSVKLFIGSRLYKVLQENSKVERVIFASGEPTLNPDLIKYVKYAKKQKYEKIAIISNGRNYAYRKFCLELISSGVNEFIISLHGHNRKIHDFLTRAPGSYDQTTQGIANISGLRHKISKFLISHVVNKANYEYLGDFLKYIKQFRVDHISLLVVQPRGGNMEKDFLKLMPKYSDLARVLEGVLEKNPEVFISNISRDLHYLSILDLPLCISKKLIPFIGFGEIRLIEKDKKIKEITNLRHKIKGKKCASCCYFDVCEGVYENYIKHYGWGEFKSEKNKKIKLVYDS
jgi:MoaA/NifB/PqqE/SkfB family radical SAM enzyme